MHKLIRVCLLTLATVLSAFTASAQSVTWKSSVEPLDGDIYRIVFEASIPTPYHMYDMGPYEGGPNATTIVITPGEGMTLDGGVEQLTTPERHYDEMFSMEIGTFSGKAQFAQRVHLTAEQATAKAQIEWMICDDTSCMPPDDTELTITVPAGAKAESVPAAEIKPRNAGRPRRRDRRTGHQGCRRQRIALVAHHRSHPLGLRRPPDALRLPHGPDDRLLLPQG